MFVCSLDESMLGFCYSDLTWDTGGFELASTITLVLQANRLTNVPSHPKIFCLKYVWKFIFHTGSFNSHLQFEIDKGPNKHN